MGVTYAVRNIMTKEIVSLPATAALMEAMQLMVAKEIGSVVAVQGDQMVGILTERDVLKCFCSDPLCGDQKIQDVMSSPLITIEGTAPIGQAADVMATRKIRRLMVAEQGSVQGIITERDLMRATLDVFNKLSDAWL